MGPLFSALILALCIALALVVAFMVVRTFQPRSVAVRVAPVFVAGAAIGGVVTVFGLSFFTPATLAVPRQVIAYLAVLAIGAVLGGVLLVIIGIKCRVLTLESSRPTPAASI